MAECVPAVTVRRPAFLFRRHRDMNGGSGDGPDGQGPSYLVESCESETPPSSPGTPDCEMMTEVSQDDQQVPDFKTPIVGYEVMEERARFTVFKVRVEHHQSGRNWFVYRRYTDFVRLNKKLKDVFPGLRFSLPPKRWFGSNFDPLFLEDRLLGLQAFVDSIMPHKDISRSEPIRRFFCLDEPPGPEDSIEESWARCESLEEVVCQLQGLLKGRTQEVELLKAENTMLRSQQMALLKSLKVERAVTEVSKSVGQFHSNAAVTCPALCCDVGEGNTDAAPLEDRSTGDGSTGSRERLSPVGDSTSLPNESVGEDGFVDSSTPIKKS